MIFCSCFCLKFITFFSENKIIKKFYFNSQIFKLTPSGGVIYKNPPIANFATSSKSPIINLLNFLDLKPKNVYPLHNTLDKKDEINYKLLDKFITYHLNYRNNKNISDWVFLLKKLIKNELKYDLIYSLAILGYSNENRSFITYGPHILITKKIKFKKLVT